MKSIASKTILALMWKGIGIVLSYLIILSLGREYGAEFVGLYGFITNLIMLLGLLGCLGYNIAALRFLPEFIAKNSDNARRFIRLAILSILAWSIFIGMSIFGTSEYLAIEIFHQPAYILGLKVVACLIPIAALNNFMVEAVRAHENIGWSEFLRAPARYLLLVAAFILVTNLDANSSQLFIAIALSFVCVATISALILNANLVRGKKPAGAVLENKSVLYVAIPMMFSSAIGFLMTAAPILILEATFPTSEVGVYIIASKLAMLVSLSLVAVNTIVAPKISASFWGGRRWELQELLTYASKLTMVSGVVSAVLIWMCSDEIVAFLGEDFVSVSELLFILLIGQLINSATGPASATLSMSGNQNILLMVSLVAFISVVIFCLMVIPGFGAKGAAMATTIGLTVLNLGAAAASFFRLRITTFYVPTFFRNKA